MLVSVMLYNIQCSDTGDVRLDSLDLILHRSEKQYRGFPVIPREEVVAFHTHFAHTGDVSQMRFDSVSEVEQYVGGAV